MDAHGGGFTNSADDSADVGSYCSGADLSWPTWLIGSPTCMNGMLWELHGIKPCYIDAMQ